MLTYIVAIAIADAIICGFLSAYLADEKGYSAGGWSFVGLLLGIFGLIAAAGLPVKSYISKFVKKCPECIEMINQKASVCRYCGHSFSKNDIILAMGENLLKGTYDEMCDIASELIDIGTVPALISVIEKAPGGFGTGFAKQAAELLKEKADSSLTPRLIKLLNRSESTSLAAIQILTKIRDTDAIRALVDTLAKSNLRNHVVKGLEKIGEEAIPYLQEAVKQDKGIRKHAQKVIDKIQKAG